MRLEQQGKNATIIHTVAYRQPISILFSYETAVARMTVRDPLEDDDRVITLGPQWNCSVTTTKHVCQFLGLTVGQIAARITMGVIKVETLS